MGPPPQLRWSAPRSSRRPPLRRGARSACTLGRQTAFSAQRPASQRVPLGEARCGSAWGVTLRTGRERAAASQTARSGKASSGIAAPERAPATIDGLWARGRRRYGSTGLSLGGHLAPFRIVYERTVSFPVPSIICLASGSVIFRQALALPRRAYASA